MDERSELTRVDSPVDLQPAWVMMVFNAAGENEEDINDVADAVIEEAERRGLFYVTGSIQAMDRDNVPPDSILEQVLTGRGPKSIDPEIE